MERLLQILEAMPAIVAVVLCVVWIVSLVNWDGSVPCELEDCDTCPYSGGCPHEEDLRKQ